MNGPAGRAARLLSLTYLGSRRPPNILCSTTRPHHFAGITRSGTIGPARSSSLSAQTHASLGRSDLSRQHLHIGVMVMRKLFHLFVGLAVLILLMPFGT